MEGRQTPNLPARTTDAAIADLVKQVYGKAALRVIGGQRNGCCGASAALDGCDPITSNLYSAAETDAIPGQALAASLGCGNPTALAELKPGETVLDLGSGGGIDVLLSARRVGEHGKAYGLDMTDEMLALARDNQRRSGLANVEFLHGEIENIPLPGNTVDVIVSNCVINLSGYKDRVLQEAFRVLKPGGRLAVSDVVARGDVPAPVRASLELWAGCVAGALTEQDYTAKLEAAGFEAIEVETTRVYSIDDARQMLEGKPVEVETVAAAIAGRFISAFIRARKPAVRQRGAAVAHRRADGGSYPR